MSFKERRLYIVSRLANSKSVTKEVFMKFQFSPKNASSNEFIPAISNRKMIDGEFVSGLDELDLSYFNDKKFLVANSAGDATSDEVMGASIKDNLSLEEALGYTFSIRNDNFFFPKVFVLDGEDTYLLDPLSTEVLASDPNYYAHSIGGSTFPILKSLMVPGICKIEKKPANVLNTIVTYQTGEMELIKVETNETK